MISQRGIDFPSSPIRNLSPYAYKAEQEGKEIIHLNIGQPDIPSPKSSIESIKHIDHLYIPYTTSEGNLSLRNAISKWYEQKDVYLDPNSILLSQGASEAIVISFFCSCEKGDEIIFFEPYYSNYESFASACELKVVPISCEFESNFAIPDVREIENKISPKTKAIFLCSPGNPSGKVYSKQEIESIIQLALKYDLFIFSDEVYSSLIYDNETHSSLLEWQDKEIEQRVIIIDSFSKIFNLCGIRLGFLATKNKDLYYNCLKYAQARLSSSFISQIIVEKTLVNTPKQYYTDVKMEYKKRRDTLIKALSEIEGVKISIPSGAFYLMAKLPVENSTDFCTFMLKDFSINNQTVMLAPGSGFYKTEGFGKNEVRIAYVLNTSKIKLAVRIIKEALKAYHKVIS